jgi:hypothetical protein
MFKSTMQSACIVMSLFAQVLFVFLFLGFLGLKSLLNVFVEMSGRWPPWLHTFAIHEPDPTAVSHSKPAKSRRSFK